MTARTYAAARRIAREYALRGETDRAVRVLSNLLWHVEAEDGGFIGLSDAALADKIAADPGLNEACVYAALWAPMRWPEDETTP